MCGQLKAGKAWSEMSRQVYRRRVDAGWVWPTRVRVVVQRFSLVDGQEQQSSCGRLFLEPQNNCTTAAASSPMSIHEREPLHNNAHARVPHPPGVYLRQPHVTFQTRPSPLLTVRTRNDDEAYNAHVSGEAWKRGYI